MILRYILLVSALLLVAIAMPAGCRAEKANHLINLKSLLQHPYNNCESLDGCFFQLDNNLVVFFSRKFYKELRMLASQDEGFRKDRFVFYNPVTNKVASRPAAVISDGRVFSVEHSRITEASMERLRLTKEWKDLLHQNWPAGSSLTNLYSGSFLITGGSNLPGTNAQGIPEYEAQVYDSAIKRVVKRFSTRGFHTGHSSLLFQDGTVLLAGGSSGAFEMINVEKGESEFLYNQNLPSFSALSSDSDGNQILFGGQLHSILSSSKDVLIFNAKTRQFRSVGKMRRGRAFDQNAVAGNGSGAGILQSEIMPEAVERLKDYSFMVCGGSYIARSLVADFRSGFEQTGEVVKINGK